MKLVLVFAALVILAGCATTESAVNTVTVKVPVPVACLTEEPGAPDLRYAPPYDSVFEAIRDLLGDKLVSEAHANELRAALKSCK